MHWEYHEKFATKIVIHEFKGLICVVYNNWSLMSTGHIRAISTKIKLDATLLVLLNLKKNLQIREIIFFIN